MLEYWLEPWIPQSGRIFVDVGANVGSWTRYLAPNYEQVHAIEPNPDALPELKANLPDNVFIHEVAAWHCEETVRFTQFARSVHLSSFFEEEGIDTGPKRGSIELPGCRIDSLQISGPVDFLKIDTEGAEVKCLAGAEQLIARDRPWLLVEVHTVQNFFTLVRLMADWGYLFSVIRHPDYMRFSQVWYAHCFLFCQPMPPDSGS